jgi:hypothetical protein
MKAAYDIDLRCVLQRVHLSTRKRQCKDEVLWTFWRRLN